MQSEAVAVLLRQDISLILPAGSGQPLGMCLNLGGNHTLKFIAVELQVTALLQAAEGSRDIAGKVALLHLDTGSLLEFSERCGNRSGKTRVAIDLEHCHVNESTK